MAKDSYERGVDTRRLYHFEAHYFRATAASRILPMGALRLLAARIWREFGGGKPMPKIVAGKGTPHGGAWFSYSQGDYIQLSRNQRNMLVLIHELIHSMGYDEHDRAFVKIYLRILIRYLRLDKDKILTAAKKYRILE